MAKKHVRYDEAKKAVLSVAAPYVEQEYDVGGGGTTEFTTSQSFTSTDKIEVFQNGLLQREGASHQYQRDVGQSKIIFNETVPEGAWVLVRIHV